MKFELDCESRTRVIVTALAVIGLCIFGTSRVDSSQWADIAIGCSLRPPVRVLGGWWRLIVALMDQCFSVHTIAILLRILGIIGYGIIAFLTFGLLERVLPMTVGAALVSRGRWRIVLNLLFALGTFAFITSDSLWHACQGLSPVLIETILLLVFLRAAFDFTVGGDLRNAYMASCALGFLAGGGMFGIIGFILMWFTIVYRSHANRDAVTNPLADPEVRRQCLKRLLKLFGTIFCVMALINYCSYDLLGGAPHSDFALFDLVSTTFWDYLDSAHDAAGPFGWLLFLLFTAGPAIFVYTSFPKLTIEDRLPSRIFMFTILVAGFVAWTQVSPFPQLATAYWSTITAVDDPMMLVIGALVSATTVVWTFSALFYNVLAVDFRQIVKYQYEDASREPAAERAIGVMNRFSRFQTRLSLVLLAVALVMVWPARRFLALKHIQDILVEYCHEVARECEGRSVVLTDGALDDGVELAAKANGCSLIALSMLSGSDPDSVRLRQRAANDESELDLLECGAAETLWTWRHVHTNRLDSIALQFGFSRRESGRAALSAALSGLVGRLDGEHLVDDEAAIERTRELGERIIRLCQDGDLDALVGCHSTERLRFVQWRVAQMCRVRADYAPSDRWGEGERYDEDLARRLDDCNDVLDELKQRLGDRLEGDELAVSAREGLKLGLDRADFRTAKIFADAILARNPSDIQANFAMGMYHLVRDEHRASVPYFERVLEAWGDEPAVLNNLATIHERLQELDLALGYAERAHRAAPENPVILNNLTRLRQSSGADAAIAEASSPDGRHEIRLYLRPLSYEVRHTGEIIIARTPIDLEIDGVDITDRRALAPVVSSRRLHGSVPASIYKHSELSLEGVETVADFGLFAVRLVARDDGVAYRMESKVADRDIAVTHERTGITIATNALCHVATASAMGQEESRSDTLVADELPAFDPARPRYLQLPLLFTVKGVTVAVTESDGYDFPVLYLARAAVTNDSVTLESHFAKWPVNVFNDSNVDRAAGGARERHWHVRDTELYLVRTAGERTFPWRVFVMAEAPSKLCEADIVQALARPPRSDQDFSWVRPGKVAWEWWNAFDNIGDPARKGQTNGCTTATYRRFIDFAASNRLEYVILDEGWSRKLDIWQLSPDVDVCALIDYARERNVGIILWMAWAQVEGDEERVAEHFSRLGVKGFKVDFMDRSDAQVERFLWKFADVCARHHLLLDWHGCCRPRGLHRRFPNVLNYEGVMGLEWMKFSKKTSEYFMDNDVKNFFVRMTAGPLDYTPGAMRNFALGSVTNATDGPCNWRVPGSWGTRSHQLALMILYEAPLQMLCDSPTHYEVNRECLEFLRRVPTVWRRTVGLGGTPDTFAAVARQAHDGSWWIAGITNGDARRISFALDFLERGRWTAEIFRDDVTSSSCGTDYRRETMPVERSSNLSFFLAPGGGFAIHIVR